MHVFARMGLRWRPALLANLAGMQDKAREEAEQIRASGLAAFEQRHYSHSHARNVDVEAELRERYHIMHPTISEENIESRLYHNWKSGGFWGETDASGDYTVAPSELDDDTTSIMSMSTTTSSAAGSESDASSSGRRTPTQEDPFPAVNRVVEQDSFNISDLARLLDPKTPHDREEAQMLSRHLSSPRPLTRSQYRRTVNLDKARLLHATTDVFDEEAELEDFILERRAAVESRKAEQGSWASGAEGMGAGGPQCVVCQSSPRVVLVWPCGCLSICDDCRVGVAARNFANCLCCRTAVVAYSRLYVP